MYEAQLPSDWTYIVNDCGAKALFCADQNIYNRVHQQVLPNCPSVRETLCFDTEEDEPHSFGNAIHTIQPDSDHKLVIAPSPDDLASLIYTSGTTGKPKGVELTHGNFSENIRAAGREMVMDPLSPIQEDEKSLSFLPWAHSYGQTCELWTQLSQGGAIGISRGIPTILEDMDMVGPTQLFSVPTLYKRIYDGVHNTMEAATPIRRSFMRNALQIAREKRLANIGERGPLSFWERLKYRTLNRIVLDKIRARFGGQLRRGFVAGAACPREVMEFMDDLGIPLIEGYGLTETSPMITVNMPEYERKIGTVGRAIKGVKVYILDEDGSECPPGVQGEICCSGHNVMKGYYKNPEGTKEVVTEAPNGARIFHSGDMGSLDEEGYLTVTGRIKEQYKLENGKYVVPGPVEEAIALSRFVEQVVLYGANRPHNIALVVPDWEAVRLVVDCDDATSTGDLATDPQVAELIDHAIAEHCIGLKKYEIPQKWAIVDPFTAANDMLTPKLSIRRHKVFQAYVDVIDALYDEKSSH